jgi:endonuclease YncB( thermonuclease family)
MLIARFLLFSFLTLLTMQATWAANRYAGISTRCLVTTQAEQYMYAGIEVSGGAKTVRIGAQSVTQIANNNFIPRMEIKTFPNGEVIYSDFNAQQKLNLETILTLSTGLYTVTVSPATNNSGIGLVYAYETNDSTATLASISTRCYVDAPAEHAMTAGIELKGGSQCTAIFAQTVSAIANNAFLPTLNLQTFPDGKYFTQVTPIYTHTNPHKSLQLQQTQILAEGLYTATVATNSSPGIGIVAMNQANTCSELTPQCKVVSVQDGDSLTVQCSNETTRVRMYCIDAPEFEQIPYGNLARDYLRNLIPIGSYVSLNQIDIDQYGRVVAEVFTDKGENLNQIQVQAGKAAVYSYYCNKPEYDAIEATAKNQNIGIWSQPGLHQQPWEWRRLNLP